MAFIIIIIHGKSMFDEDITNFLSETKRKINRKQEQKVHRGGAK